jgi:hypothetical protein
MLNTLAPWTYLPFLSQYVKNNKMLLDELEEKVFKWRETENTKQFWSRVIHFLWINHPQYICGFTGICQALHMDHAKGSPELLSRALKQLQTAEFASKKEDNRTPRFGKGEKDGKE